MAFDIQWQYLHFTKPPEEKLLNMHTITRNVWDVMVLSKIITLAIYIPFFANDIDISTISPWSAALCELYLPVLENDDTLQAYKALSETCF